MNRVIKFRAWLKEDEEMVDVDIISWVKGDEFIGHSPVSRFVETIGGHARYEDEGATSLKDVELMQWTGLTDKNGKEIYEGDVVAWEGGPRVVRWNDENTPHWSGIPDSRVPYVNNRNCEVIGNIYENPELMEKSV